jgi:Flp pilus assembly pilin Flp
MRKTANFLTRFWDDQNGATPPEVAITIAIVGVILAGTVIRTSG